MPAVELHLLIERKAIRGAIVAVGADVGDEHRAIAGGINVAPALADRQALRLVVLRERGFQPVVFPRWSLHLEIAARRRANPQCAIRLFIQRAHFGLEVGQLALVAPVPADEAQETESE